MGDAQPAAGPSAVPWQAWPCREGNLNPSLLQHQGEMVKISLFFRGGKKSTPTLFDRCVYESVYRCQRQAPRTASYLCVDLWQWQVIFWAAVW